MREGDGNLKFQFPWPNISICVCLVYGGSSMTVQSGQSFQAHWIQIEKRDPFFCEIHFFDENLRYFDANVLFFCENLRYFDLTRMCFLKKKLAILKHSESNFNSLYQLIDQSPGH